MNSIKLTNNLDAYYQNVMHYIACRDISIECDV